MKLMFITKAFGAGNGAEVVSKMHYNSLCNILDKNEIYVVNLREIKYEENTNYICYGRCKNKILRLKRYLEGNTFHLSNQIIDDICFKITKYNISVVFIDDSIFGNLVKQIKKQFPKVFVISFYHDIKRNLYPQWMKHRGIKFYPEGINGMINEYINQKYADINITLNDRDSKLFKKYYKKLPNLELPITVPSKAGFCHIEENEIKNIKLLFIGTNYYPNIEGIKWFSENVFSKLESKYILEIVGNGMEVLKDNFDNPRIHVIGTVDDLNSYYRSANIIIAPIFSGGGMKVKTAEAFSYGKCFIGTKESLEGYYSSVLLSSVQDKVIQCNTAEEFLNAILKLGNTSLYNDDVLELFENNFSINSEIRKLSEIKQISNLYNEENKEDETLL